MSYKDEVKNDLSDDFNVTKAETRYTAITEGIAAPLNDLKSSLEKERKRYDKKCRELDKRNKYNFLQEKLQTVKRMIAAGKLSWRRLPYIQSCWESMIFVYIADKESIFICYSFFTI